MVIDLLHRDEADREYYLECKARNVAKQEHGSEECYGNRSSSECLVGFILDCGPFQEGYCAHQKAGEYQNRRNNKLSQNIDCPEYFEPSGCCFSSHIETGGCGDKVSGFLPP